MDENISTPEDAAAKVLGNAAMPKPDCAKCGHGRVYHVSAFSDGTPRLCHRMIGALTEPAERCDCDGYEPMQSDTDIPSSKLHGGQLASLHPDEQRAMQTAHRMTVLKEALAVCIVERNERSDYEGEDYVEHLQRTEYAVFKGAADYLGDAINVLEGER